MSSWVREAHIREQSRHKRWSIGCVATKGPEKLVPRASCRTGIMFDSITDTHACNGCSREGRTLELPAYLVYYWLVFHMTRVCRGQKDLRNERQGNTLGLHSSIPCEYDIARRGQNTYDSTIKFIAVSGCMDTVLKTSSISPVFAKRFAERKERQGPLCYIDG